MTSMTCLCVFVLAVCAMSPVHGWGYIFSRFRPEAGNNWGYGSSGVPTSISDRLVNPREQLIEALLGEELLEEQLCEGRRCTANEQCCPDHVCVDFEEATSGTCMPALAPREGAECSSDSNCGVGLICNAGTCAAPEGKKQYNEACTVSSECDVSRSLCCQVVRRHRQGPRKLCGYFQDPLICIGHVATDQVIRKKEHYTNGERRYRNHYFK